MDGQLLTLPCEQLLNLNSNYFLDEKDTQAEGDEAPATDGISPQITLTGTA